MSYENSKLIRVQTKKWLAFSWWFVDNLDESLMWDSFSTYLRNGRLKNWWIIIRPWFSLFKELSVWKPISIWVYNDKLIIRYNQDTNKKLILVDEDWVVTEITTDTKISSDNKMNFLNIWNRVYCFNWVDDYGYLEWTTYSLPVQLYKPSFGVIWWSSMWISWFTTNSNTIRKSVANNFVDFTSAWKQDFEAPEAVTWFGTTNETLYIFTKNSISAISLNDVSETPSWFFFNSRPINTQEWAINHNSIINVWVNTYFLTPNNKIQQIIRWNNNNWYEILELSHREWWWISNLMDWLDKDQSESFWIYLPQENIIKWHLKKEWSTINDIVIIYNVLEDKFLIDEFKYFNWSIILNWQQYSISAIEPKIFKDEFWNDDDWSAIDFEYHTKSFDFLDKWRKKVLRETFTSWQIGILTDLIQEIYIDWSLVDTKTIQWNNYYKWDSWIWIFEIWTKPIWEEYEELQDLFDFTIYRTKWNLNIKWKKIKYVFKSNSLWWRLFLLDLQHRIEILSEKTISP